MPTQATWTSNERRNGRGGYGFPVPVAAGGFRRLMMPSQTEGDISMLALDFETSGTTLATVGDVTLTYHAEAIGPCRWWIWQGDFASHGLSHPDDAWEWFYLYAGLA